MQDNLGLHALKQQLTEHLVTSLELGTITRDEATAIATHILEKFDLIQDELDKKAFLTLLAKQFPVFSSFTTNNVMPKGGAH